MTGRMLATKTFTIQHEVNGVLETGQFTVTRLSAAMIAREAILRAQYLGGMTAMDPEDRDRAFVMARIDAAIQSKPAWFDWASLPEDPIEEGGVALKVYEVVKGFLDSFRRPVGSAPPHDTAGKPGNGAGAGGEGAGGAQHTQPGLVGSGAGVLQGGVSSPLDP